VDSIVLNSPNPFISPSDCHVRYNAYNKPTQITEDDYRLDLFYGADGIRNKTVLSNAEGDLKTTYFVSDLYEKEIVNGVTRHLNYIYAGNQIVGIYVQSTNDSMYYVHTDHLGSYNVITNQNKEIRQKFHFDPWGNRMGFTNWEVPDTTAPLITTRGFTGHEHLEEFRIINMKGRLYDPVIGRFFSPDPFVQFPDFTQNFNRYSYCLNNPIHFTDPTGNRVIFSVRFEYQEVKHGIWYEGQYKQWRCIYITPIISIIEGHLDEGGYADDNLGVNGNGVHGGGGGGGRGGRPKSNSTMADQYKSEFKKGE
jgi:RHS repeat-associated protein